VGLGTDSKGGGRTVPKKQFLSHGRLGGKEKQRPKEVSYEQVGRKKGGVGKSFMGKTKKEENKIGSNIVGGTK